MLIIALIIAALASIDTASSDTPYTDLGFESPPVSAYTPEPECHADIATSQVLEDSREWDIIEQYSSSGSHQAPWISPSVYRTGSYGMGFDAKAVSSPGNVADRGELVISYWCGDNPVSFFNRRYLRFDLNLHHHSDLPDQWVILSQVWQYHGADGGHSPPFSIHLRKNGGNYVLEFEARNDDNPSQGGPNGTPANVFYSKTISEGQWYKIIVQLQPDWRGGNGETGGACPADGCKGQIAVWFDRNVTQSPNALYREAWGYDPESVSDYEKFSTRIGVYRREQNKRTKVFFDDVRFGSTGASVDY